VAVICALATVASAAPAKTWTLVSLGALGSRGSIPLAINNRGDIVGYSAAPVPGQPYDAYHPFLWQNGTMTDLGRDMGTPPGSANTEAEAINDKGTIVGSYYTGSATQAFIYKNGAFTALGTLGGSNSSASAVNDLDVVVGSSQLAGDSVSHAFAAYRGYKLDLGTLGGNSGAVDINNRGTIVGTYQDASGVWKAWIIDRGRMRPLFDSNVKVPAGNQYVAAINDQGTVTGNIDNSAFVYEDGKLTILNTLPQVQAAGWATLFIMDINDRGWITGWGLAPRRQLRQQPWLRVDPPMIPRSPSMNHPRHQQPWVIVGTAQEANGRPKETIT
jgi:probable HAF family extracellular repeat protein